MLKKTHLAIEIGIFNYYMFYMKKEQYYTLNVLRGLSALFVLFYHFFVFFFAYPSTSAGLLQIQPVTLPEPSYLQMFGDFPLNLGHLGVGFFFLISGFLIQPSLERYPSFKAFIVHKVFRLWPSYALCFFTGLLCVWAFCVLRNTPFPYTSDHILAYFFWTRDIFHYSFIDGAVWSLEIQIKFYLLAAILWGMGRKNFLEKACASTVLTSFFVYGLYTAFDGQDVEWFYLVKLVRHNLQFFMLILLGMCTYSLHKKQISWQKAVSLWGILVVCFLSPLFKCPEPAKIVSYLLGFCVFSYLMLFHKQTNPPQGLFYWFTKRVSDISYPVYIGHVLPGYTLMFVMIEQGLGVYLGAFLGLLYTFVMADIVHRKVEAFFIHMNNKINRHSEFISEPQTTP